MVVSTQTERLKQVRKGVMELYISDHPLDCLTCAANGDCELQDMAGAVGLRDVRYGYNGDNHLANTKDESNPYFTYDPAKCIVCSRCVRACEEVQGTFALTIGGRGFESRVNITNINVYNSYRNARVVNGVSGLRAGDFTAGRFNGVVHPGAGEIRTAGAIHGQMPFGPSRENLAFSGRTGAAFTPSGRSAASEHFFTHQAAPAVQHMEVTRGFAAANQSRGGFGGGAAAPQSRGFERQAAPGGGRTFGSNPAPVNDRPASAARPGQNGGSGWRNFNGAGSAPASNRGVENRGVESRGGSSPAGGVRNESPAVRGGQAPSVQNSRPGGSNGGWNHFGEPGAGRPPAGNGGNRTPSAPQGQGRGENFSQRQGNTSGGGGQRSFSPPVVRERQSNQNFGSPRGGYNAPSYSAPRQAPAPQRNYSAPSYSAPRSNGGGGGGFSAPRGGGGAPAHSGGGAPARSGGGGGGGGHRR